MKDILEGLNLEVKCLDHGLVRLVDVMPRLVPDDQTADYAIVQAARVSYGQGTKKLNEDIGLIRYLMRHRHTTPLEMVEFKFHCKLPIFVARQFIRHRTSNVNEYSGRYSEIPDTYYQPNTEQVRLQSTTNKQGGTEWAPNPLNTEFRISVQNRSLDAYKDYEKFIQSGVAKELARIVLPVNYYTEWYWKCDLHNLLHFLALRCDSHAQQEIRVFADAMLELIKPVVPITVAAWEDYHPMRGGVLLTRMEIEAIKNKSELNSENKREQQEWQQKREKLGL